MLEARGINVLEARGINVLEAMESVRGNGN